jgi:hypothetical protein
MNFANVTLGEMLSHKNEIIKRNGLSVLKQLQRERDAGHDPLCEHKVLKQIYMGNGVTRRQCQHCGKVE